jgi:hypothetical protein
MDTPNFPNAKALTRGLYYVGRALLAFALLGAAGVFGFRIGDVVRGWFASDGRLAHILPTLSLGLVVALLVTTFEFVLDLRAYLKEGGHFALFKSAVAVGAAAVLVGAAVNTPPQRSNLYGTVLALGSSVTPPIPSLGDGSPLARLVVTFDQEAVWDSGAGRFISGTEMDPVTASSIRRIARDLAYCSTPDRPVSILITGFASTSGSPEDPLAHRTVNLMAAGERAEGVAEHIRAGFNDAQERLEVRGGQAAVPSTATVDVYHWVDSSRPAYSDSEYAAMISKAGFRDRHGSDGDLLSGTYLPERGRLNRRVDIDIKSAGECSPAEVIAGNPRPPGGAQSL